MRFPFSYPCCIFLLSLFCIPLTAGSAQNIQSLDSITTAVTAFLSTLRGESKSPPVISVDSLDPRLRLSMCDTPLEVSLAPGARSTGRMVVMVRCSSPRPWSVYVPAKIAMPVFVVVAARPLLRDQVITPADIAVEQRDSSDLPAGYLTDPNQILGKSLTRPAAAGSILIPGQTRNPIVIRRGERVTLLIQSTGLTVRSMGVALADAGAGDRISVRNESSRRIVEGIVEKAGVVVMEW
ncbi:flagella basal body P-ring formation protein FlgA [Gammaproteobacteria bacterium]